MLGHIIQRMVNTVQIGSQMKKQKKAKCACLPRHFLWAGTIYSAIKSCPPWVMENAKNNTTLYIYTVNQFEVKINSKQASSYNFNILFTYLYDICIFCSRKRCRRHWFFKKKSDSCLFPSVLLSVGTEAALRARTKALQCGISALDIMTLRGCSGSYGRGGGKDCFWFCSCMKCHLEFDKIWRSNPLWELHWTAHFLILFSCYNQALTGDPCHCVIKLIILPQELLWAPLSRGQDNWQPSYTIKLIMLRHWPRICKQMPRLFLPALCCHYKVLGQTFLMCVCAILLFHARMYTGNKNQ